MESFLSPKKPIFEMIVDTAKNGGVTPAMTSDRPIEDWHVERKEGQLAVDVIDNGTELVVISTMAGALTDRLEVFIHDDLLTIRGERVFPLHGHGEVLHQECFWGKFSRTVVLPIVVKAELAQAEFTNGILLIRIPKRVMDKKIPITIVDR